VLSIGLLVDDAIVVVENVERLIEENPELTAREATIKSMEQIQIALGRRSRWCCRRCSCRWPSSADRPA
jgi:hypothetical protein